MSSISLCTRSFLSSCGKLWKRMASSKHSYEDAIHKLNSLQSNRAAIEQIRKDIKTGQKCTNLEDMENYLRRSGVSLEQLDQLSVIHVAGTKGKGSTSAMCESILRAHGYRTGLFTSPHLVAVRERIRLAGSVVTKEKFAQHFHQVYDMLYASQAYDGDMPKYFAFLTVLAFRAFLEERVDVAVVEVGIGGRVDYTNVLRKVPVVGISSLGLDHTSILGNTIQEIAWAKAGVLKPGCIAYSARQPRDARAVLAKAADDAQCTLHVVPEYNTYTFPSSIEKAETLPINLEAYQSNASLAIQLSHAWLRLQKTQTFERRIQKKQMTSGKIRQSDFIEIVSPYNNNKVKSSPLEEAYVKTLPYETVVGLRECKWPGRYHVVRSDYATFYLDGAHTKESMEICAQWFSNNNSAQEKFLIFSATGDRDSEVLLRPLRNLGVSTVFFVTPTAYKNVNDKNDNYTIVERNELLMRCDKHAQMWRNYNSGSDTKIEVMECVSDALIAIKRTSYSQHVQPYVLITGSLHLVGAALSILEPCLSKD